MSSYASRISDKLLLSERFILRLTACHATRRMGEMRFDEARHLEYQLGPAPPRPGRAAPARASSPDVLCLQETKVINDLFPAEASRKLGYVHQAIHGQKGYHGVAMLSKCPSTETDASGFLRQAPIAATSGVTLRKRSRTAQFLCAGGRRHSRSRAQSQIRAQARFPARDGGVLRKAGRQERCARDPGRRSECGAARERCLESQATSRCRQPHAGRDRIFWAKRRRRSTGST